METFTAAYQTMEKARQEAKYIAEGGDLETGMKDPMNATGTTITNLTEADFKAQLDKTVRETHPNEFKANTFTDRLDEILGGIRGPATSTSATQVGPL
jgi:hypothetical protein